MVVYPALAVVSGPGPGGSWRSLDYSDLASSVTLQVSPKVCSVCISRPHPNSDAACVSLQGSPQDNVLWAEVHRPQTLWCEYEYKPAHVFVQCTASQHRRAVEETSDHCRGTFHFPVCALRLRTHFDSPPPSADEQ